MSSSCRWVSLPIPNLLRGPFISHSLGRCSALAAPVLVKAPSPKHAPLAPLLPVATGTATGFSTDEVGADITSHLSLQHLPQLQWDAAPPQPPTKLQTAPPTPKSLWGGFSPLCPRYGRAVGPVDGGDNFPNHRRFLSFLFFFFLFLRTACSDLAIKTRLWVPLGVVF